MGIFGTFIQPTSALQNIFFTILFSSKLKYLQSLLVGDLWVMYEDTVWHGFHTLLLLIPASFDLTHWRKKWEIYVQNGCIY